VWPVLVLMCCEETCSACCSPTSLRNYTARVKHVRHRVPGDRRHGGLGPAGHQVAQTLIMHGWPRDDSSSGTGQRGRAGLTRRRHAPPHQAPRRGSLPCRRTTVADVAPLLDLAEPPGMMSSPGQNAASCSRVSPDRPMLSMVRAGSAAKSSPATMEAMWITASMVGVGTDRCRARSVRKTIE